MHARILTITIFQAVLFLFAAVSPVKAQTNFVLHTFAHPTNSGGVIGISTNSDGINPNGWLTLSGATLYGTSQRGGINGAGTLFAQNTNGTFSLLYAFPKNVDGTGNTLGAYPNGGLVISNTVIYGTTQDGGTFDQGVIFQIGTNGTGITDLHIFSDFINTNKLGTYTNNDGVNPSAGLIMSGNRKLYGTAANGGNGGNGVVFTCSNTTFTVLHQFTAGNYNTNLNPPVLTNSDGANPYCMLLLSGTNLFGTTSAGGTNGFGTIFKVSTNGGGFTVLHHFNTNGASPTAGLVLSGGTLFGIGGSVVYCLGTNGSGFTVLQDFGSSVDSVDSSPAALSGMTVSNGTLYGAVAIGGDYGNGQIISLNTNGAAFTDFHDFTDLPFGYPFPPQTNMDGAVANGGVVLLNSSLYGTANQGGTNATGVLFRATPPPAVLSPQISGRNFQLSFQTLGGMSYTVQQNTNLAGTNWIMFTNIMGSSSVTQFTVPTTNPAQLYFRVRQP
jgi:uncharacterized repeat protein (TIGR03803 family)